MIPTIHKNDIKLSKTIHQRLQNKPFSTKWIKWSRSHLHKFIRLTGMLETNKVNYFVSPFYRDVLSRTQGLVFRVGDTRTKTVFQFQKACLKQCFVVKSLNDKNKIIHHAPDKQSIWPKGYSLTPARWKKNTIHQIWAHRHLVVIILKKNIKLIK